MTNNKKFAAIALFAAAIAAIPTAPAEAHGWHHGDGLLVGAVAGVAGAAIALATLPFHAVEAIAEPAPVVYAPAPAQAYYYPPQQTYYAPQPQAAYYAPQPVAYYSYPAGYYNYGYYGYRHGYGYR